MIKKDFDELEGFFTASEVERTGAHIEDVKKELMLALLQVRKGVNRRIKLLKNGMTTGKHSSTEHPDGIAVDFFLDSRDGPVSPNTLYLILTTATNAGFRGMGFYFNGLVWSFHLDLREEMTLWTARKKEPGKGSWVYKRMNVGFPIR